MAVVGAMIASVLIVAAVIYSPVGADTMDHSTMNHSMMNHTDHSTMNHSDHSSMNHSDHSSMNHSNHDMPEHNHGTNMTDHSGHDMSGHDHSGHDHSGHDHSGHDMSGSGHDMSGSGSGQDMSGSGSGQDMSGSGHDMSGMGHSGHGMNMPGMIMYFHTGYKEFVLFEECMTESKGAMAGACVIIFVVAVLYEGLKFLRELLLQRSLQATALTSSSTEKMVMQTRSVSVTSRMFSSGHVLQTILHVVQVFISYCLMLVFMTYNVWLCLAVVLGAGIGYFVFGWKRAVVVDSNEHCH